MRLKAPYNMPLAYPRQLYGRGKGHKLSLRQEKLISDLLPRVRLTPQNIADFFKQNYADYRLEIGFGGGEYLAAQAHLNPQTGFIGCEPFVNGMAKILTAIDETMLTNIRLYNGDARDILTCLPAQCLDKVYLLYPDPWPKMRHHKRRFINAENLAMLYHTLKPQGTLFVASDSADYIGWTLAHISRHDGFAWRAQCADDWRVPPTDWMPTRYEKKAKAAGRLSTYLQFERI